jgi:PAS domain S-box-containing protein
MTDRREQAEARLRHGAYVLADIDSLSKDQARTLLHELQVHQIELEMQNEELRDAQVALDVERARYFDLYDLAPVGYCTVGEEGLINEANLCLAGLLGTTRSELIKQRWARFVSAQDADLYHLHRKKLLETGEPQSCELRMTRSDGGQFWGLWAATLSPGAHGGTELRAVLSDITARKDAEQGLRETNEQYHHLFTSIGEGFCVVEMIFDEHEKAVDYRFVELNPSFESQSGLHDAMGKRAREMLPNLETHWFETYGKVALSGQPVRILEQAHSMQERWFDVHAYRLGGPGSRRVAILFNDCTDRVQVGTKLRESKEIADRANRAKSEFLSNMSHELRTPLNAILGFAQLIDTGPPVPTPTQKRNVDYILKAGWYLLALVDEILDLAVIESGKLSLSMEAVSLEEVMGECQAMLEQQAKARGIRLSFPHFDSPCHVDADRTRLKQVLSNLLSNAIKYNRPQGTVDVDWVVVSPGRVRISIRDTGEGLSADKLPQLFQPFNRLGKENGPEQGTGIGLVVSKRAVELMGGEIGVHSVVGRGSVFWVELRLIAAPAPATGAGHSPAGAPDSQRMGKPRRTVLYIEDNPANLALMEGILANRADIRLLTATDGEAGITLAREALPDAILMDINLPGVSGTDAMNILAGDPATAAIPVLALSANATAGDIERGLAAGYFRYLTKPIKVVELMDALAAALAPHAATGKPTHTGEPP